MSRLFFMLFTLLSVGDSQRVSSSCGVSIKSSGLIYGGKESEANSWPWHGVIYQKASDVYLCGATLVTATSVITAAHCIQYKQQQQPRKPSEIVVKLGKHDLSVQYERGSIVAYPTEILIHPDWNIFSSKFESDIAVIIFEDSISFTAAIQPICLWQQNNEPDANSGVVVGYGMSETPELPTNLREIQLEIVANEDCFLKNPRLALISSKTSFCAGKDSRSGPCHGAQSFIGFLSLKKLN